MPSWGQQERSVRDQRQRMLCHVSLCADDMPMSHLGPHLYATARGGGGGGGGQALCCQRVIVTMVGKIASPGRRDGRQHYREGASAGHLGGLQNPFAINGVAP